jgi:uracil-DNA glycosylase
MRWAPYRWRKNVWAKIEHDQCAAKKIKMTHMVETTSGEAGNCRGRFYPRRVTAVSRPRPKRSAGSIAGRASTPYPRPALKVSKLSGLQQEMAAAARRLALPIDRAVYREAGRNPLIPIPYAGNLRAQICIVGRDLGRDEVLHGQPLVGASGRTVRLGLLRALGRTAAPDDRLLEEALPHVLLCNLVPYKPVGNRAFSAEIREGFRPFLELLLIRGWQGAAVLTLGNEACAWFERYSMKPWKALAAAARYEAEIPCEVRLGGSSETRRLTVCPLPHPSPANATWRRHFPELLARRLEKWL